MVYYTARSQILEAQARTGTSGITSIPQAGNVFNSSFPIYQTPKKESNQRDLSVNHHRSHDYCTQLHVETSVEYDLPSHIYPPKNAEPILMIHPEYTKRNMVKHGNSLGSFLAPGSSPGHGSNNSSANNESINNYLNATGTSSSKRSSRSNNTSCTKACYATCNYQNSPSIYTKSSNSSRNRSTSTVSSNLSTANNTPEHSIKINNSSKSKPKQSSYNQHQRALTQQYQQPKGNTLYQLPPPSYGTATGLYGYRQQSHAATVSKINTPMVGSVVPSDLVPQMMSSAHIVRSRGSPKVRTSTRRHHAVLPEYHLRRPRSSTVGAQSGLASSAPKNTSLHPYQHEIASDFARLQEQHELSQQAYRLQQTQLEEVTRLQNKQIAEALIRRQQQEHDEGKQRLQKVSAVPYIFEGRVADTPHMTSGPLTPTEMMDQDPYPRNGVSSASSNTTPSATQDSNSSRLLRYSDVHTKSTDIALETAKHHRQSSTSNNNTRQKTADRNSNYWNFYEMIRPENVQSSRHKKSNSVIINSSNLPSKNNTPDGKIKNSDHHAIWRNFTNIFEEAMASPQAIDLTSSPKSSTQFSPSTTLLSSQFLGVPTPPVSNLASGSTSHFQSNTSNFINNIYQLSNMNPPIYNLVY